MGRSGIWFVVVPMAACAAACGSPCSAPPVPVSTTPSRADAASSDAAATDAAVVLAPAPDATASAGTGTADAGARVGAASARFGFARVSNDDGDDDVDIVLTARPFSCDAGPSPAEPYLSLAFPRGPGGTYFGGAMIGVEGFVLVGDAGSELIPPYLATASLVWNGPYADGQLRFESPTVSASGRFHATLCPMATDDGGLEEAPPTLDADAPQTPFTMIYAGTTVRLASATAMVDGEGKEQHLGPITFTFTRPPSLGPVALGSSVVLQMTVDPAGATGIEQKELVTTKQPVVARLGGKGDLSHARGRGLPPPAWAGNGAGWMRLSRVSYTEGAAIEGELVVDLGAHSGPRARARGAGRFTARVEE